VNTLGRPGRRADRRRASGVVRMRDSAAMPELTEDLGSGLVHRLRHGSPALGLSRRRHVRHIVVAIAAGMNDGPFGEDQPHPAAGPARIVLAHRRCRAVVLICRFRVMAVIRHGSAGSQGSGIVQGSVSRTAPAPGWSRSARGSTATPDIPRARPARAAGGQCLVPQALVVNNGAKGAGRPALQLHFAAGHWTSSTGSPGRTPSLSWALRRTSLHHARP
jgi:hypothetical protein